MGHATASGRPQVETAVTPAAVNNANATGKAKITKADFDIRWEWQRGRLQGQENYGYYIVVAKRTGREVARGFSSKRDASAWLGKTIKIANKIRSGEIRVERDENGRVRRVRE